MWWFVLVIVVIVLTLILMFTIMIGAKRWQSKTGKLLTKMETARSPIDPVSYDSSELNDLPSPVQHYFRTVLKEGQPLVSTVSLEHSGTFNLSETGEQWKPFKSTQRVTIQPPGFVWDARIRMAPGMSVSVHDAYVGGMGVLTAKLFGLLGVMEQPNTPELAQGELMRFLAEATWYPTALLPSQGVVWEAVGETQASATLTDGKNSVSLVFQFDSQGLISTVRSDGRYRNVNGMPVATPWQGRFWDYELREGMLVPLEGEVAWLQSDGEKPYWRGRIGRITYEYAR